MVEVREQVVEELDAHQETLRLHEYVQMIETHHLDEGPGVDRDLLAAYADAVGFDVDVSAVEDRLTDSHAWEPGDRLYELDDGRISTYPQDWHETVSDPDDVLALVELIAEQVTEPEGDQRRAVTENGVPEQKVVRVAGTVAEIDRETVRDRLHELHRDDELEEFATQNREPRFRVK